MGKSIKFNHTNTGTPANITLVNDVNFGSDFDVKQTGKNELTIVNVTCPLGQDEQFRVSYSEIANIYKGTKIDASCQHPLKKGVSILVQYTCTGEVTDSVDTSYQKLLPFSAHMVIKVPAHELVNDTLFTSFILNRMVAGSFNSISSKSRFASLIRGALLPADM